MTPQTGDAVCRACVRRLDYSRRAARRRKGDERMTRNRIEDERGMRRRILQTAMPGAVAALVDPAAAGGQFTSRLSQIGMIPASNIVWIKASGAVTGQASCTSAGYFATAINSDAGKAVCRTLLAAQVQGLPVTVWGTGQCTVSGGSEDIQY